MKMYCYWTFTFNWSSVQFVGAYLGGYQLHTIVIYMRVVHPLFSIPADDDDRIRSHFATSFSCLKFEDEQMMKLSAYHEKDILVIIIIRTFELKGQRIACDGL